MQITVHGTPTELAGKELLVGKEAPAARITKLDGTKNVIGMIAPNIQLLIAIPSLKTEVCSLGAKKFNEMVKGIRKLSTIMITTDDPEFVKGYKESECIDSAELVIDEERQFAKKFGLLISEGKLKDRLARAVFVIDREGLIAYKEVVPEVVDEVDYDACLEAINKLVNEKQKGHTHENWMSV
ncbi:redoxin domain-containing protein [bacterium]|nr:redoxin domain-containing protein [bacterium]MBU1884169.1 redoxin domain-containing protein [bacterium]